ncbi:hypothetical protein HMPREF1051_2452 [Neisseria sicca VK64]|uniref:Uncharacterized protein n=1 Tax=Neisseria sicca VK64 TaxID=1095748 RepID=I2NTX4_NEISI|nr:hypothetical protein HMPREF1051_2452 [Neisseria sicca VK64]
MFLFSWVRTVECFHKYSGLNLNQYGVASPCRTDLNLIHYTKNFRRPACLQGRLKT